MQSSDSDDTFLRAVAAAPFISLPGQFTGTERFELVRLLGEGGFGQVYEAVDHRQGGRVALKVLRRTDGLYRFKREFRALAELVHPNLVRLYELVAVERTWFFTMELIDGVALLEHAQSSEAKLREAFGQLAQGLLALHRAGIVHRDVKPSNVLVDRSGRTVLLDFGLAVELGAAASQELAGTPLYMSPEQCAEEPIGEASDWYAFGTMLYQVLTGELPFRGSVLSVLKAKQSELPRPPGQVRQNVAPDLEQLCMTLLHRDPAARPNGEAVVAWFQKSGTKKPAPRTFVGRRHELELLLAQLEDTRHGRRTVTLVRGPSGVGKSALLKQFVAEAQERHPDLMVLAGRCHENESVPYKALDAVVDELARKLPADATLVPPDAAALVQLFPVLKTALGRADVRMEPAEKRSRGAAALRELLSRVARRQPLVMAVDDLQWGDADSALLLATLVRPPDPPPVCFVGCFRDQESPLLRRLKELRGSLLAEVPLREVTLGELERQDAEALAQILLRERAGDVARAAHIAAEAQGNPFFVHELTRTLGDAGVALPGLVELRLARLPAPARALLSAVALAGVPIDVEVAAEAAGVRNEARDLWALLRAEHLVRGLEGGLVECYHNRIREAVARAVTPARSLHRKLAEALERRGGDAALLSFHWREAGDFSRAATLTDAAAERAVEALAFERAAELQESARELRQKAAAASLWQRVRDAFRAPVETPPWLEEAERQARWQLRTWQDALLRDDPDAALARLESLPEGELRRFHTLVGRANVALYRRQPPVLPDADVKPLLRFQCLRIQWADLQARAHLGAGESKPAGKLAARMLAEKTPWGDALALLVKGQVLARRGDRARAEQTLSRAIDGFAAADMPLHQAAARRARGLILPDAAKIVESAEASLAQRGVTHPERLATLLAPGI